MFKSRFLSLFTALTLAMGVASAHANIAPQPIHTQTMLDVVTSLQQGHYNRIDIDDTLSEAVLEQYLASLDPERSHFLAGDIKAFDTWRYQLDDQILQGETEAAFEIFNRYQERRLQRLDYIIGALQDDDNHWDFKRDDVLETDRSKAPWIETEAEMQQLWRKQLKSALLSLKLADKTIEEAEEILLRRYQNQKQRTEQTKSDDVFESFVNALTHEFDPHTQYFSPRGLKTFRST